MPSPRDIVDQFLEMHDSLTESVSSAGGDPNSFNVKKLKEITAYDLLCQLATNGIRFSCRQPPP